MVTAGDETLELAVDAVQQLIGDFAPKLMVVCGSGLSDIISSATILNTIEYSQIPGMYATTVPGHAGKLHAALWGDRRVLIFQGRLHYYEGHPWNRITLPIRIAHRLGVTTCILTNSSGAINTRLRPGSMVIINDHLNFMGSNSLVGVTSRDPESMFPDLQDAYSPRLRKKLNDAAAMRGLQVDEGVYVAVSGPNYETPAEIRAFGILGGDIIGMSTVGEILMARHLRMECCAISCVANLAAGLSGTSITHHEVQEVGKQAASRMRTLLDTFIRMIDD